MRVADLRPPVPKPEEPRVRQEARSGEAMHAQVIDLDLVHSELRHRFRNIVAVTQSLVNQTLRDGVSIIEARDSLNQRLAAMGGAVDLLLRNDWQPGSLRALIRTTLTYPVDCSARIRCDGPDLQVGSAAVMALTLALHELQTNAIKYGALSSPDGIVELFWKVIDGPEGQRLWMQWAERDGPPVRPPEKQGFGTRLISKATGRVLGGKVELEYTPTGLSWFLVAPIERIAAS